MLNKVMNIHFAYRYDEGADLEVFKRVRVWLREEGGTVYPLHTHLKCILMKKTDPHRNF